MQQTDLFMQEIAETSLVYSHSSLKKYRSVGTEVYVRKWEGGGVGEKIKISLQVKYRYLRTAPYLFLIFYLFLFLSVSISYSLL